MERRIRGFAQRSMAAALLMAMLALSVSKGSAQTRITTGIDQNTYDQATMEAALVLGPGKNLQDARECFEQKARKGYAPAMVNLAVFYMKGWGGLRQNYGTGLYWLKEAAKQGQPRAYTNLGIMYLRGWGVPQNNEEALNNFRIAADHGETGAMVDVGYMTEAGMGTAKSEAEGVEWYQRAAERGDAWGQNNLADAYLRGLGVSQSDKLAAEWFQKAAEQGHTGARIKLGFLYMTGRGVDKDPVAAYGWILAASQAGDHRGEEYLNALQANLKAEQLEAAMKRARELQAVRHEPNPQETTFVH